MMDIKFYLANAEDEYSGDIMGVKNVITYKMTKDELHKSLKSENTLKVDLVEISKEEALSDYGTDTWYIDNGRDIDLWGPNNTYPTLSQVINKLHVLEATSKLGNINKFKQFIKK